MSFLIVSIILLLIIAVDAVGDALRAEGKLIGSHVMESVQIASWIAIWALFDFDVYYIAMYVLARFAFFDLIYNKVSRNNWLYIGNSSYYDRLIRWFAEKARAPIWYVIITPKVMATAWFISWALTNANR